MCVLAAVLSPAAANAQSTAPPFTYLLDAGMLHSSSPPVTASASARAQAGASPVRFGPRQAEPQLPCRPGDSPETDLQGRVPPTDIQR